MKSDCSIQQQLRQDRIRVAVGRFDQSLLKIHEQIHKELITIPQLEFLDRKLLQKYLQFFFSKSVPDLVRDVCLGKDLTDKLMLNLLELAIGKRPDEVFPMHEDGRY